MRWMKLAERTETLAAVLMMIVLSASMALQVWIVYAELGWFAGLVAIAVFPALATIGPVFIGLSWGNWLPALVTYGGGAAVVGLYLLSPLFKRLMVRSVLRRP